MIDFSFSTVYMAVIASNILLIMVTICFWNKKMMVNAGRRLLSIFVFIILLRLVLPFELPFAVLVSLPSWVSRVVAWIQHPFYQSADFDITPWTILICIWIIGFIVSFIHHIRVQAKARYYILSHCLDATMEEPYRSVLQQVYRDKGGTKKVHVLKISGLKIPMLYGVFSPNILIPENWEMSPEMIYYVFYHELSHYLHYDLVIKNIVRLVSMIYWWNPLSHILVHQIDIILEMRIDNIITSSNAYTVSKYLHCLLEIAEQAAEDPILPNEVTMSFLSEGKSDLEKRFIMLTNGSQKKNIFLNVLLSFMIICVFTLSYCFIWEAYYMSPEIEETVILPSPNNIHAVLKEDGTYDIRYGDFFIENIDSLEYYPEIPIFTEQEDENEEHEKR